MFFSIKSQINEYKIWLNIANQMELNWLHVLNRYDFITFNFIFISILLLYVINFSIVQNVIFTVLLLHLFVGFYILKPRALVLFTIEALKQNVNLGTEIDIFLNHKYSIFLVSQGKKPLSENDLENLQNHTINFSRDQITRGGRQESIKRYKLSFLKKEKIFLESLFFILVVIEFIIIY